MDASKGHKLVEPFHKTKLEHNDQFDGFAGRMEVIIKALFVSSLNHQFWNIFLTDNSIRCPRPCASNSWTQNIGRDSWMRPLLNLQ